MKTIKIISRHQNLLEAVKAAGIDLSYNEPLAHRDIKQLQREIGEAFVVEGVNYKNQPERQVLYTFKCDLLLLNKFEPFHSCLDDSDFTLCYIQDDSFVPMSGKFAKNNQNRKALATMQKTAPHVFVTCL